MIFRVFLFNTFMIDNISFMIIFDFRLVFKLDSLGKEILRIAFPAALAVAADPIASLIDTVFIGHIGIAPHIYTHIYTMYVFLSF